MKKLVAYTKPKNVSIFLLISDIEWYSKLYVWRVSKGKYACVISIASSAETTPDEVRKLLSVHEELVHVTVEINQPR